MEKEKPDVAGVCLFVAAAIALLALLFVTDANAWKPDQEQWQKQTQHLELDLNPTYQH